MLEEITKSSPSLAQEKEKNALVEIHNLTCYWDKVKYKLLTVLRKTGSHPGEL